MSKQWRHCWCYSLNLCVSCCKMSDYTDLNTQNHFRKGSYLLGKALFKPCNKITVVTTHADSFSIPLRRHKAAVFGFQVKDLAAAQTLPEKLQIMPFNDEKLPTMLAVAGEWRPSLSRAVAVFCTSSAAALEAIIVLNDCNEILLNIALGFTKSLVFCLSTMLRLNAFLRLTLAGVLLSHEEPDQHGHSLCFPWSSSQTFTTNSCTPLRCGGGRPANRLKSVRSLLLAVPAVCRCSLSVCKTILTLINVAQSALSALCRNSRNGVSTIMTLCGCIRPLVSTLQIVTGYSTQVLGIVWDVSSLISST